MSAHTHEVKHEAHGSLKSYIVGFILSIILTVIPYFLVVNHVLTGNSLIFTIMGIGVLQLLIQVIFFLHLSLAPESRSTTLSFIFTVVIVLILVVGSLWIMWNLNYNMMEHS
ncbi:MAG: cytochrome o ubiquinol oxidase subunit [Pseudomonadota bacterium]|jgi:cytochrome o ubiquinol oxidase operon protein cyoD